MSEALKFKEICSDSYFGFRLALLEDGTPVRVKWADGVMQVWDLKIEDRRDSGPAVEVDLS